MTGPTPCWTDNKANQLLSSGEGTPTRMRHAIRRFNVFKQRVEYGEVTLRHVRDAANASDYLTKFVDAKKTKFCDDYATNRSRAVKIRTTP